MNVQQDLINVSRFAVTLLALTGATATVGLSLMPMEEHAMVSAMYVNLELSHMRHGTVTRV